MNGLSSSLPRERYAAIVEVEVKAPGELTLDLTYVLGSASWQALYDMRALGTESETPGVQLVAALPKEFELATVYAAAVCSRGADRNGAAQLVRLLCGDEARPLREAGGFELN